MRHLEESATLVGREVDRATILPHDPFDAIVVLHPTGWVTSQSAKNSAAISP